MNRILHSLALSEFVKNSTAVQAAHFFSRICTMAVNDTINVKPGAIPVRSQPTSQPAAMTAPSHASLDHIHSESHWQIHRNRKRAILKEFPEVSKLYGNERRTQYYAYVLILFQLTLAWSCRNSFLGALALGIFVGPFVDNGVLCLMHESMHNLIFRTPKYNRILSLLTNSVMIVPISEIFRQHHYRHHQRLGNENSDVDVPTAGEIVWVGNSSLRKALWLTFNMIILPARSLKRLPVEVNAYLAANWVVCVGLGIATFFLSRPSFIFLVISALQSQGLHPANTRQVQRHIYNGDENMLDATLSHRPSTFSYYGPMNLITLNVGYHLEHHDFCSIPWTRLPELRRIAGEKWYPTDGAHSGRGIRELWNFVTNPKITLEAFCHEH